MYLFFPPANVAKTEFCQVHLDDTKLKSFMYAVKNHYWYQMYVDDLPIWGIVGDIDGENMFVWTHKKFEIGYNGKQIVDVNLTSEGRVKLEPDAKIPFTYEVVWKESHIKFQDRFDKYLDPNFFQHRVCISRLRLKKLFAFEFHQRCTLAPQSQNIFYILLYYACGT